MLLVVLLREILHHRVQRRRDEDLDLRLLSACLRRLGRRLGRRFGGRCLRCRCRRLGLRRRCRRLRRFRGATSTHPHQHRCRDDARRYLTIHSSHRLTLLIDVYTVRHSRVSDDSGANASMRPPPFACLHFPTSPSPFRAGCRVHAPVASAEIRGSPDRPSGSPAD